MSDNVTLLGKLRDARNAEERIIPIYTKHLSSAVFWTGIAPEKAARAREVLGLLAKQSQAHKVIVDQLIKKVSGGEHDADT